MAKISFLTAQQELAAQLGLDYTDTDTSTLLKRWLNLSYKDIVGYTNWTWLQGLDAIVTVPDNTSTTDSLTVSATAASTTITFSSTIATSQANRYIQLGSANDWYKITAHTAGTATATISPAYVQTTNLTAGAYTIRTRYYSLSSTTDKVYEAMQAVTRTPIKIISARTIDERVPYSDAQGNPYAMYMWGEDSNGYPYVSFYPTPSDELVVELRVKKKATELSADSDTAIFPERFESIWLDRAAARGFEHKDDDRANAAFARSMAGMKALKSQDQIDIGKMRVLESIDDIGFTRTLVPFPPEFGEQP